MTRRAAVGLLLGAVHAGSQNEEENREFLRRVVEFERHWDVFIRKLFGCPLNKVLVEPEAECSLAAGMMDLRGYQKAREAAKKLFKLTDA